MKRIGRLSRRGLLPVLTSPLYTKTHARNQVYEELEAVHLKAHFDLDAPRRPRSLEEMAAEARELRGLFPEQQWAK